MAKQWKCARCSTKNDEGTLTCSNCRMIRGAVVVPGTWNADPDAPPPASDEPAAAGWPPSPGFAGEQRASGSEAASPAVPQLTADADQATPSYWRSAEAAFLPAEAAEPPRLGRRVPIGWLLFVILLGAGAVASFITSAGRSDTGEIVNDGDMMATDLRVGDCFDLKDPTAEEISDVTARPCTDPHEYELFWTGSMAAGAYPTEAAFDAFFEDNCVGAFGAYVGKAYVDSRLDIYWLYPLEAGWDDGDRSIQCAAYHPANNRLTGSVKATAQ